MRFLVDNQLPAALARFLEGQGTEAKHVWDLGLEAADDRSIWDFARENGYTVISKDEDFLHLATLQGSGPPALIWVRIGNCRKQELLVLFERLLPQLLAALADGQQIVEIQP